MKRLWVLLIKELRELVTWQTIAPIILVVLVFIGIGKLISAQANKLSKPQPIMVVDSDHSAQSAALIALLGKASLTVNVDYNSPSSVNFKNLGQNNAVIEIPAGFGRELASGHKVTLETYSVQKGSSLAKLANASLVSTALAQVNAVLAVEKVAKLTPKSDPTDVLAPIVNDPHIVVNGKVAAADPSSVESYISSQVAFVPVVLFIVILFAGQMVATAMANEKENKTLETLLSLPISRQSIVTAKMLAAGIVSGVTAAAYVYGLNSVQSSFTGGQSLSAASKAAINQVGLTLGGGDYLLLGLALFLGILVALSIALILGAFADNIKSVQSLIMPLMILLLVPYITSLVGDPSTFPRYFQIILAIIPFTYTFQAMPNLYSHNYSAVLAGAGYELVCFIIFILIAARIFGSDSLLTLRFRGFSIRK